MPGLPATVLCMADACAATVSRRDLIAMEFAPSTIDYWLAVGLLERTGRGEYRVAGSDNPLRQRLATMLWRAGKGARLAGPLVCALHGLMGFPLDMEATIDHIAVPPGRQVRGVDFTVVRTPVLPEDRDQVLDLPAVTVARALVGASARYRAARILAAHDDALFKGLVRHGELLACAGRLGRAYGAAQARRIAGDIRGRTESPRERDLLAILRPGDPRPEPQVWVCRYGRWHRLDFAYLEARLAVEYDSRHHDRSREQDADRDLALMELQIQTVRVTTTMMRDPQEIRRRLLTVRQQRMGLGLTPLVPDCPPWLS